MKKKYTAPDFELIQFLLNDVILTSPTEESLPEQFATEGDEFDFGF